ncbi:hypothetical protein ES705_41381 [subsurface metagenome]
MTGAVGNCNDDLSVLLSQPVEITAYDVEGLIQNKMLWKKISQYFIRREGRCLNSFCIFDAISHGLFLLLDLVFLSCHHVSLGLNLIPLGFNFLFLPSDLLRSIPHLGHQLFLPLLQSGCTPAYYAKNKEKGRDAIACSCPPGMPPGRPYGKGVFKGITPLLRFTHGAYFKCEGAIGQAAEICLGLCCWIAPMII